MPSPRIAALVVLALIWAQSCVTPGSNGTGSNKVVLMRVSGRDITAEEFLESPPMRNAVKQFVMYNELKSQCSKRNVKVDEEEVERRLAEAKQSAAMGGENWEDRLKQIGLTEEEYRDALRGPMLFEALTKQMVVVTEEEIKKVWETEENRQQVIDMYARDNHLPDSEKAKLTLEKLHDYIKDSLQSIKSAADEQENLMQLLINNATLDLSPTFQDKSQAKKFEDLILNNAKKKTDEESETPEAGAGGPPSGVAVGGAGAGEAANGGQGEASEGGDGDDKAGDAEAGDEGGDSESGNDDKKDGEPGSSEAGGK